MPIQWTLALRYLSGRKLRTFLTTLAVIFGVVVIFGMNTLIPTMMQSFQATMMKASSNVDLTITSRTSAPFSADALNTVRGVEGVRLAQGQLSRSLNLPANFYDHNPQAPDRVSVISLVGVDPRAAQQMRSYEIQSGRFLEDADTAPGTGAAGCVITQSLAEILNLQVGDTLALPTVKGQAALRVVGIRPLRAAPGGDEVMVTLPEAQMLLDAQGKINVIEADYNIAGAAQRAAVQQAIENRLGPEFRFGPLPDSSEVFSTIQMAQIMFNIFGFLALFMGGFIIFNTFRTLVAERRRDLGMLRAVGASRRAITGLILTESLLQGAVGTLLGMLLGYALAGLAMWAISPTLDALLRVRMSAPVVSPGLVVMTVVIGLGITVLAGLLPALSAGRVTPIEALRPAQTGVESRRVLTITTVVGIALAVFSAAALLSGNTTLTTAGALLFLFSLVLVAPALVRPIAAAFGALLARTMAREGTGLLAQGNLSRQPTRAAITASTSMVAMAILVVLGGLMLIVTGSFLGSFKKMLSSDFLLMPPAITVWGNNVGADPALVDQIKAVDGVGVVSTLRFASTTADIQTILPAKGAPQANDSNGTTVALLGVDPAAFPQVGGLMFIEGDADQALAALENGRTMIINGVFASMTGAKVGDNITLNTLKGKQQYRVAAVGTDYLNAKTVAAYLSQDNLAADFGVTESVFGQINLRPGADKAKVEAALLSILKPYPQFTLISGPAYYQQMSGIIQTAFAGMYVLFIFLAVPSLIAMLNTLAIGVIERTREIGMLRAVGSTQKQVRRMILAEGLLLAALGTVFGMLAGLYLSYAMTGAFRVAGMPVSYFFPWNGLLYAAVVGLLCGGLAAIIPARQAARLQIVQALRYE